MRNVIQYSPICKLSAIMPTDYENETKKSEDTNTESVYILIL